MLEAREACSGATGRNAGHCRPDAFRGFTALAKIHGPEQAMKILQHEKLVLDKVIDFISTNKVDCDFDLCGTFDVCMGEDFLDYVTNAFEEFKAAGGDASPIRWMESEEARKVTRVPSALGAFEWKAASLHPAKLCQFIIRSNVKNGLQLFTHTPAVAITTVTTPNGVWQVKTPRGSILASRVVHATNAFAPTLLPLLSGKVTPCRAQAHKIIPPRPLNSTNLLTHTYSLRYQLHHFYSVIQRKVDGAIVLGTSRGMPGMSEETRREITGTTDDTKISEEIRKDGLASFERSFGLGDGGDGMGRQIGEGEEFGWTGIIGMTPDLMPFIGPVPSLHGQFVIAGFNGHGMARIFDCAPGLVKLMDGGEWSDTNMPECFQCTNERLEQLSK
ncbi:FAD dependent oxidoreductase [Stereum hirsutum FP-91666 SS1]|uniref:FAD dependent oxidoreductase n=1 Tax=Stereum hirsutum (strain FP-91666) TaxID=721885 RepID=R7RXA9_STEHR|nr:FAD dependent oxidoreductase [Stereum hirsutum FP-91666 SS1]EIM79984.1 FAD dependent oxidoreductase [Stereum hirsutum FP-91666 SS1]